VEPESTLQTQEIPHFHASLALRTALLLALTGAFSVALTLGGLYYYYRTSLQRETSEVAEILRVELTQLGNNLQASACALAELELTTRSLRDPSSPEALEAVLLASCSADREGFRLLGVGKRADWTRLGIPAETADAIGAAPKSLQLVRFPDGTIQLVAAAALNCDDSGEERLLLSRTIDRRWLESVGQGIRGEVALLDDRSRIVAASFPVPEEATQPLDSLSPRALLEIRDDLYGFRIFPYAQGGKELPAFVVLSRAGPLRSLAFKLGFLQVVGFIAAFAGFFLLHMRLVRTTASDLGQLAAWAENCHPDLPSPSPPAGRFHETQLLSATFDRLVTRLDDARQTISLRTEELERQVQEKTREIFESHRMLQDILAGMPQAVLLLAEGDAIAFANPVAEQDFGARAGERLPPVLAERLAAAAPGDGEVEFVWGQRHFMLVHFTIGASRRSLLLVRDVTSRRAMEKQLLQAQKIESVSRLAGGVAHEFNNALASILPGVEILRIRITDEKALAYVDAIEKAALRGADVVRKLLAFSRSTEAVPRSLDFNKTVEMALSLLRPAAKAVRIEWEPGENLPLIRGDEMQIQQLVFNLGLNAMDAVGATGTIRFETWTDADRRFVRFAVSDTGPGIPPRDAERIFDPFFTTKEPGKGTGLGLAIAYAVVEHHGGRIRLVPQERGARFEVEFPAVGPTPAAPGTRPSDDSEIVIGA
jgi:signal transduction histidine kinase